MGLIGVGGGRCGRRLTSCLYSRWGGRTRVAWTWTWTYIVLVFVRHCPHFSLYTFYIHWKVNIGRRQFEKVFVIMCFHKDTGKQEQQSYRRPEVLIELSSERERERAAKVKSCKIQKLQKSKDEKVKSCQTPLLHKWSEVTLLSYKSGLRSHSLLHSGLMSHSPPTQWSEVTLPSYTVVWGHTPLLHSGLVSHSPPTQWSDVKLHS